MVAPQPFFRPRGTPFSVLHRIRALIRLGHTVELVAYPFGESPVIDGLVIHRSGRPPGVRDVAIGPSPAKLLLDGPIFLKAFALARTGRFDLLHTHEEAGAMGAWISRRCGLPHLYDMHSILSQQFANFARYNWSPVVALFRALERFTLQGSDAAITVCPELYEHVIDSGYNRPVALIENSLEFDHPEYTEADVAQLKSHLGLCGARAVVYTGTLESYQGLDLLVGSARAVLDRKPRVKFVIVGGTAAQIEALEAECRAHGVASAFVLVPSQPPERVPLYHRLADVLITTRARGTNTPLKIYQYLRAGRPIVATAIRSHTQVLDERSAELVEPTAPGVARGLIRVLENAEHARSLALTSGRLARERYSEQTYFDRLSSLLAELFAGERAELGAD
jgi:glycosyltransferase involved in cell wall biosynthesis